MIACFAWTNTQILNITNAKINLFADDKADLYIRMGGHMSEALINSVKKSGVFENIYCLDPFKINYTKLKFGFLPNFRVLFLRHAYSQAYKHLLERLNGIRTYDRAILAWFYTENVFLLDWWSRGKENFKITFVDEGTGSYCYTKKQMIFPVSLIGSKKALIKRYLAEYALSRKMSRKVDSICYYRPEFCRPDIDYKKLTLPIVSEETNPLMCQILRGATSDLDMIHFSQYEKRKAIYLSTFSVEGASFDEQSLDMLTTMETVFGRNRVIAKIHTGNTNHAVNFAKSHEKKIYVDRDKYIFEGLYMQLPNRGKKVFVSCVSTASIYPKFMFNEEPYVIFTYRLYNTYKQVGVERDDWMSQAVIDAYEDKSKVMIPNSMYELKQMLKRVMPQICDEFQVAPNVFLLEEDTMADYVYENDGEAGDSSEDHQQDTPADPAADEKGKN